MFLQVSVALGAADAMLSKIALVLSTLVGSSAIELTPANFDEKTAGKQVFIKFLAPW